MFQRHKIITMAMLQAICLDMLVAEILPPNTARDLVLQVEDVAHFTRARSGRHIDEPVYSEGGKVVARYPRCQSMPVVAILNQHKHIGSKRQFIILCQKKNHIPMPCHTMPMPCFYCHCFSLTSSLFIIPTMKSNASCYSYPPNANLSHATLSCRWSACP